MKNTWFAPFWQRIGPGLFDPLFNRLALLGELTEEHVRVIKTLEVVKIEDYIPYNYQNHVGRPQRDRAAIARAFLAKATLNCPTTVAFLGRLEVDLTLRRICGFGFEPLACEATFSNAFREISKLKLTEIVHKNLIKKELEGTCVYNLSRDATDIEAREKPDNTDQKLKKEQKKKGIKRKKGRPKKGEEKLEIEPKIETNLEKQQHQTLEQMLSDVPTKCDTGSKKNAKGYVHSWNGYKLHLDCADNGLVLSAYLSSASVHDSRLALPLEITSNRKVQSFYSLMDSAYDAGIIRSYISEKFNKVPVIDINKRRKKEPEEMLPHQKIRYKARTTAERTNSALKDSYGARYLRVKGPIKAMCHLMFGVLAFCAEKIISPP